MNIHAGHNGNEGGHIPSEKASLLLKGGMAASGLIVAPYAGDALGISKVTVPEIMAAMHGTGLGTGIAGGINSLLSQVPLVGETLSAGSMATTATSGIIGIGGILLGNYLDKKRHKDDGVNWGKIIKYSALTTSILIALPSILTGISVGLTYFAAFAGSGAISSALGAVAGVLGSIGGMSMATAGAGIGSAMTHLITCGGAALSVAGAIYLDNSAEVAANSVKVEIANNPNIKRGEPCKVELRIKDENGKLLTPDDLRETFTKKLHVMVVDNALNDYSHIHPEFDKNTGLFILSFTPKTQGEYNVWSDCTLEKSNIHIIQKNKISAERDLNIQPVIKHANSAAANGANIEVEATPPLAAGKDSVLSFMVTNNAGNPIKFEPVMGAYAHLVGFSKDGENFIHCHPENIESNNGNLKFHVTPEKEGFSKFFLQIKTGGQETIIPFGQFIQPPAKFTQKQVVLPSFTSIAIMSS